MKLTGKQKADLVPLLCGAFEVDGVRQLVQTALPGMRYDFFVSDRVGLLAGVSQFLDQIEPLQMLPSFLDAVCRERRDVAPLVQCVGTLREHASREQVRHEMDHAAIPVSSPYYVERETDRTLLQELESRSGTATIRGYRLSGKSSLMARLDKWSRKQGHRTIRLDCGSFSSDVLGEIGSLLYSVADELATRLDLDDRLKKTWKPERDPLRNLTRFVEDAVLSETDDRIGLLIDNADAALQIPDVGRQFFNLLRSWHNARADGEPWERLSLVVSHRIEPAAWITDLNNSPFNVGLTLRVGDLLPGEVALLNERYGGPLTADELTRVMSEVSGHPYLVRLLLFQMATGVAKSIDQWLTESVKMGGAAYPLLMSLTNQLRREPQLARAFQQVVKAGSCPDGEAYQRLWELGLVAGDSRRECRPRCAIYVNFLNQAT